MIQHLHELRFVSEINSAGQTVNFVFGQSVQPDLRYTLALVSRTFQQCRYRDLNKYQGYRAYDTVDLFQSPVVVAKSHNPDRHEQNDKQPKTTAHDLVIQNLFSNLCFNLFALNRLI